MSNSGKLDTSNESRLEVMTEGQNTELAYSLLCGAEQATFTCGPVSGSEFLTYPLSPPKSAKYAVAMLSGFYLEYANDSHNLRVENVQINNPIITLDPNTTPVLSLTMELSDNSQHDWNGTAYVQVLYFTPYWS